MNLLGIILQTKPEEIQSQVDFLIGLMGFASILGILGFALIQFKNNRKR